MPIEDRRMVGVIGDYLRERNERDYVLFMTGVYLGRRISDILQYRVRDLRGKDRIAIAEQKTGETILLPINPHLQKIYRDFFKGKKDYEYAFRNSRSKQNTPISRIRVWQILNEAADAVGYKESLSCHTLRKTFAYWLYMDTGGDIVMVQEVLGHADPSITRGNQRITFLIFELVFELGKEGTAWTGRRTGKESCRCGRKDYAGTVRRCEKNLSRWTRERHFTTGRARLRKHRTQRAARRQHRQAA